MNTIIEIPDILAYPDVLKLDEIPELKNNLVYVIKAYPLNGLAVMIHRKEDNVFVRTGDWNGDNLDPNENDIVKKFLDQSIRNLVTMMKTVGVGSAIFYITYMDNEFILTDVRLSLNKFSGPGMIRDLFSKIIKTQEIKKIVNLDDNALQAIKNGTGNYSGDLIIKSSAFDTVDRTFNNQKMMYPKYAKVIR